MTTLRTDSTHSGITIDYATANIEADKFNSTLSAKESGALSAYNKEMKTFSFPPKKTLA